MGYAFDLEDIGHYYTQYRRLMAHWEKLYGAGIHTLDYDALVREPEPVLRALTDFCRDSIGIRRCSISTCAKAW